MTVLGALMISHERKKLEKKVNLIDPTFDKIWNLLPDLTAGAY